MKAFTKALSVALLIGAFGLISACGDEDGHSSKACCFPARIQKQCGSAVSTIVNTSEQAVGDLVVTQKSNSLVVRFSSYLSGGWFFQNAQLAATTGQIPVDTTGAPNYAQFPNTFDFGPKAAYSDQVEISFEQLGLTGKACGEEVKFAFHAKVAEFGQDGTLTSSQDAWAFGEQTFATAGKVWWFSYKICCCETCDKDSGIDTGSDCGHDSGTDTNVEDTYVEDTHVEDTHVEDTHVEDTHVEDTHIEDTFVPDTATDTATDTGSDAGVGCSRTIGYWKTHNEFASKPSLQQDWPLPEDEYTLLCGKTWLSILNTPSSDGSAWTISAKQWIGTMLNLAAGASASSQVTGAVATLETLLKSNCGGFSKTEAAEALLLKDILDAYNNGKLGTPHCN